MRPRIAQRIQHRIARARAVFRRRRDVVSVAAHAEADELRVDARAARLRVLELFEHDGTAAIAEHEAVAIADPTGGCALRDRRCAWTAPSACPKPPRPHGVVAISPPPATITSASPYWMVRMPSPMAWVDVVHAVTTPRFGPFRLYLIDRCPEIMLMIDAGTKNGEIFFGIAAGLVVRVVLGLDGPEAADAGAARRRRSDPDWSCWKSMPESATACMPAADAVVHERIHAARFLRR